MIFGSREENDGRYPRKNKVVEVIHLYQIERKEIGRMWEWVTNHAENNFPSLFTEDGVVLWHALNEIGVPPLFCRVHLAGQSSSRVYDVTLPKKIKRNESLAFEQDEKRKAEVIALIFDESEISFAIKVTHLRAQQSFDSEYEALQAVTPSYYLGALPKGGQLVDQGITKKIKNEFDLAILQPKNKQKLVTPRGWWSVEYWKDECQNIGNAIFMRFGKPLTRIQARPPAHVIFDDTLTSLRKIHKAGYCHRDLRETNIIFLDGCYQLIDFDFCRKVDIGTVENCRESGRTKYLPLRASKKRQRAMAKGCETYTYKWTKADDVEMLARSLFTKDV